jgi:hypothetical protein
VSVSAPAHRPRRALWRSLACGLVIGGFVVGCSSKRDELPPATSATPVAGVMSVAPGPGVAASATPSASAPASSAGDSPLRRLTKPATPRPPAKAPLALVPGVGFGPVFLGDTLADLRRANLTVSGEQGDVAVVQIPLEKGGNLELHVSTCHDKIIDIWIDDLRRLPPAITFAGETLPPTIDRELLERKLGACVAAPPRIGGSFETCQDGGVSVGHGLGTFLQLRVRPKQWAFDGACEVASDDGSAVPLTDAERTLLFKKVLNLSELSPHWHPDKPGRDPLRIVKSPHLPEQPLTMFGSPVSFVEESDAVKMSKTLAYLRILRLESTSSRATVVVTYPVEGITATATFRRRAGVGADGDPFSLEHAAVVEK